MKKTSNHKLNDLNIRYLRVVLFAVLAIIAPVFMINFFYDPGDIYWQRILKDKYLKDYVNLLMSSSTGVRQFGNERLVRGALAQRAANVDAVILGSSHAMQLGGKRMPQFRRSFPGGTLNLAVSGGTLEDIMIFSNIILHNQRFPKALLIEISPWVLKWRMDERYMIYQDVLERTFGELGVKPLQKTESYGVKLLTNAVNFGYFQQSVKRLRDPSFKIIPDNFLKEYGEVGIFDYEKGNEFTVTLNDGSLVYSKSYIDKIWTVQDYLDEMNYKLWGGDYNENAIVVFDRLIDMIKARHIEVYFLLVPYNPVFFEAVDASIIQRLENVERRINEIARQHNIRVFGSYAPQKFHLEEKDFFEILHAKPSGLDKIDFSH